MQPHGGVAFRFEERKAFFFEKKNQKTSIYQGCLSAK
jgi:hypothetical protein